VVWPARALPSYSFSPIGFVRSPLLERASAPRQPAISGAASPSPGRIDLLPGCGYEDALEGLEQWSLVWVLFVFHKNVEQGRGWRPKVQPPRSDAKRGVFATRSPHRPNPIGLSALAIERVEGLAIHVRDLDLLDGTPVLDIKPYVPYADAHPEARDGWLASRDPIAPWAVAFAARASLELAWLRDRGVDLAPAIEAALALGPKPHAYRRIRRHGDGMRLALKEWRVDFVIEAAAAAAERVATTAGAQRILVTAISSGYRVKQLVADPSLALHRAFSATFANLDGPPAR
jgi:tRNA-Thr(GGU) m(6)t(6)A37 methyltransferase TsaA